MARPVPKNLVVISDTHAGCRMALCPPGKIALDDGGTYEWSGFQEKMYAHWREFWDEWVPEVTRGEPYDVVHNGDCIDGVHHGSTTQISHNIEDQLTISERLMKPIADGARKSGGTYYHIRPFRGEQAVDRLWVPFNFLDRTASLDPCDDGPCQSGLRSRRNRQPIRIAGRISSWPSTWPRPTLRPSLRLSQPT